tara:strand:- start:469 stop:1116 length:648 start_codon:yes stop_codon:yes gene_type:complete
MSKAYTEDLLISQLDLDRTWRIKEISDLKSAILAADSVSKNVLLRALVTLSYAHWEGFIRFSARKYFEHISLRKFRYGELDQQFLRNYFLPRLAALSSTTATVSERCEIVDEILSSSDKRFSRFNEDIVNTRSNLSFDVFRDICLVCGVSIDQFTADQSFVDLILLKRRNEIAHGEETLIDADDLDQIVDRTLGLMRRFATALQNRVVLSEYKSA